MTTLYMEKVEKIHKKAYDAINVGNNSYPTAVRRAIQDIVEHCSECPFVLATSLRDSDIEYLRILREKMNIVNRMIREWNVACALKEIFKG